MVGTSGNWSDRVFDDTASGRSRLDRMNGNAEVMDAKLIKFRKVIKNRFLISGFINKNYNYPRIFEDEKGVYGKYGHIKMINFMPKMSS